MNVFRFPVIAATAFVLALSACSQTDDLTTPSALEPQFGTGGYDEVSDVAYDKAMTLYSVGILESRNVYREGSYVQRQNAFVRRYDRNGNLLWEDFFDIEAGYENENQYGGFVPHLTARAVAVDGVGNAVVAWSADYRAYVYDENSNRYDHIVVASFNYLTKYSPSGAKLWRSYTDEPITDLAVDSSANIYAASGVLYGNSGNALLKYTSGGSLAWTRSQPVTPVGVTVSSTNNIYIVRLDAAVAKYGAGGTRLWLKTGQLGEDEWGEPYKIAAGLNDELYVAASHYDGRDEACDAGFTQDYYTTRIYKLSSTGVRQWLRNVANGIFTEGVDCANEYYYSVSGLGVDTDTKGSVYIVGYQNGNGQDGFVAKYNRAGARTWKKAFVTLKDDTATSVATYDGSEVYIGGVTEGNLAHRQLGGNGDAVMRKVNNNGDRVWTR